MCMSAALPKKKWTDVSHKIVAPPHESDKHMYIYVGRSSFSAVDYLTICQFHTLPI